MKKIFIIVSLILLVGVGSYLYLQRNTHDDTHIHAGFVVYIDGVKQEYSDIKYMNLTPCSDHESVNTPEEEQIEKAHLHDNDGDVVHVHRKGAVWGDLFTNLGISFDSSKEIAGYKDGQKITDILKKNIIPNESIVIVVGDQSKATTYTPVSEEKVIEVGKKSELCGTNGG